jgi:hypothetical protein
LGVTGIVAAYTFSSGVSDAASNPERFGQTFQAAAYVGVNGHDFGPAAALTSTISRSDLVTGVADTRNAVATGGSGKASVPLFEYRAGTKPLSVVVLSGRMPKAADEVLLAPQTMSLLHAHVGGRVRLVGTRAITVTVTGSGLVPLGSHNGYAEGGWISPTGYDALFTGFKFHVVLVALTPDARGPDAAQTLAATVTKTDHRLRGTGFSIPDPISEVAELREVRELPIVLGIFLALLAVGAVGHALATAVRRRSRDLAVLRAVGMTRKQCRWVIFVQASVLALIGLVFGVPVGLALGRTVWRAVADYTPLQYVPPFALTALLAVFPLALVLANILAAWPGHRATRLRVTTILRAE